MGMQRWTVGDIRVTLVRERLVPVDLANMFPSLDAAVLEANREWLSPHFVSPDGTGPLSIHAFVVEAGDTTIVVDTCVGDRPVPGYENLSHLGTGWLDEFRAAGFEPDDVDVVLCTHLHFDHVGWNTMLVDGRWVPTFPRARYLFGRVEYEHWSSGAPGFVYTFADTVQCVVDAGQAELVETDHVVCEGVHLESTPGHSPGHASVHLASGGEHAVITGDMVHHPLQIAAPACGMAADYDAEQAGATRVRFFGEHANTPTRIFGTHFAPPTVGRIRGSTGAGWRFDTSEEA